MTGNGITIRLLQKYRELVINGVREIVTDYDVDGIHFDDYFYPDLNNEDPSRWFDLPEYKESGTSLSVSD